MTTSDDRLINVADAIMVIAERIMICPFIVEKQANRILLSAAP